MSVGYAVICHCSITDDHSRVIIHENTSSDYINANYIDVSFYILRLIYTGIKYKTSTYMCLCHRKSDEKNKAMLARRHNVFPIEHFLKVHCTVICFTTDF